MTLLHLLPFFYFCLLCDSLCVRVHVCVGLWGRPGSLLCTDPALQSVIRPVSCFSLARIHTEEETHRLLCIVILLSVSTFQFPFSPLIPPLSISLLFDTAHFFTHPPSPLPLIPPLSSFNGFPPLPRYCPSRFFPLMWYLVPETCFAASRRSSVGALSASAAVGKLLLKALRGAVVWPTLIPNQPFIYNGTLVSVPHRHSVQIWEQ